MTLIEKKKQELTDLRDKRQKKRHELEGKPKGKRKHLNKAIELLTRQIDRRKVRLAKLKERNSETSPHVVLTRISPNQSERTSEISTIVIHCTQSPNVEASSSDLAGVAGWFANPSSQVSAHVVVDSDGHSAVCVQPSRKAWHCAEFNSRSLGIEMIGYADQGAWSRAELREAARWAAHWCRYYEIPVQEARPATNWRGICTHADLGAAGGSHTDPGSGYNSREFIRLVKSYL